jgi:hypothetical protein
MAPTGVGIFLAILPSKVNRLNTSLGGHMPTLFKEKVELRGRKGQR